MADYIELQTAIKAARHAWAKGLEPSQYIDGLPAADVAPVLRSEWVAQCVLPGDGWEFEDVPYDPHQHSGPLCKRCRKTALLNGGEDYVCSNYCPHCGARMEGAFR